MRLPRALAGALLWVLASVIGLVGVLLCITIIGLPIGFFLVRRAGRMFSAAVKLMLPEEVAHPISENRKRAAENTKDKAASTKDATKKVRKAKKKVTKKAGKKRKSLATRLGL